MKALKQTKEAAPVLQVVSAPASTHKDYLVHPVGDTFLIGGLGLIFFAAFQFFVPAEASIHKLSWIMFYASFAINYPHFLSTYFLMYRDYRKDLTNNWKFAWAGIVAPILLIGALFGLTQMTVAANSHKYLGYMASLMFFLVGHHYVKQIYGCVMVTSAKKKTYLSQVEKYTLWAAMYSVWMMSFISTNLGSGENAFYGINYAGFGIDSMWLTAAHWSSGICLTAFAGLMIRKYINQGKVMPLSSWTAIATIVVWYLPMMNHAHYFYMIPFFHSVQYLMFTTTFVKNKAEDEAKAQKDPADQRAAFVSQIASYVGFTVIAGYLAWEYLPGFFDQHTAESSLLGPTYFFFCSHIFLNVHHYLMDNVIWRSDNAQMKKYL